MAQYTLPRFNTSGGQGFSLLDLGPKPEQPTLCKHKVDHRQGEDGLTPHMRKILQAKERAKKTKGAQPGQLRRFALHQTFNKRRGRKFLDDYADEELEEAYLSDKIPEKHLNRGPLFMLVGDTFAQFVNTTDDVCIYVVQRDCMGCHQMWPTVHGVVETFGEQPNLRFGTRSRRRSLLISAECPRRGVAATPPPRTIRVVAAAPPRPRLRGLCASRPRRRRDFASPEDLHGITPQVPSTTA